MATEKTATIVTKAMKEVVEPILMVIRKEAAKPIKGHNEKYVLTKMHRP